MKNTINTALTSPKFSYLYPNHKDVARIGSWLVAVESHATTRTHNDTIEALEAADPGWEEFDVIAVEDGHVIVFCPVNESILRAAGEAIEANAHEAA